MKKNRVTSKTNYMNGENLFAYVMFSFQENKKIYKEIVNYVTCTEKEINRKYSKGKKGAGLTRH